MSVEVQFRRDTAANIASATGSQGEIWVDMTNNRLRVNDGSTPGGWLPLGMSPATIVEAMDGSNVRHGGNIQFVCAEQLLSGLSGSSVASTIAFPNPCLIFGCSLRVTTAITGATSFDVGLTGSSGTGGGHGNIDWFGNSIGIAAGTTNAGIVGPTGNFSSVTVTLTANGSNFTAGAVRIQLCYLLLNPPAS
jgi:Major tropism determinant N-terminal domain